MSARKVNIPHKVRFDELQADEVNELASALNAHADDLDKLTAQAVSLAVAKALLTAQPPAEQVRPVAYAVTGPWNGAAATTVYLLGLTTSAFAPTGWVLGTGLVSVDVAAGTWEKFGVDAYTKAQADALLAAKQGAVVEQVGFSAYGASNDLPRTTFDKYVRLTTGSDGVLNLPPCTLTDVGRILGLYNYNGPGSDATQTLQATLGTDTSATYITTLPRKYVALLEVVKLERGTPYNDVVASYAVLANSTVVPQAYATLVNGKVPASQLPDAVAMYEFVGTVSQPQAVVKDAFYYVAGRGLYQRIGASASVTSLDTTNTASWKVVLEQAEEADVYPSQAKRAQVIGLFSANTKSTQDVPLAGDTRSNYFLAEFYDFGAGADYFYKCCPRSDMPDSNGMATAWWVKIANN